MQHLAAETVWQFMWEVVSGDVNEDASRLLQIYLLSYGRADANAVYNLHIRSPPISAHCHLLLKHCGSQQQQFCSLSARPHSQFTEDACLQPCLCVCVSVCVCARAFFVWRSFNSRWYFWNLLQHFTNPIILRVFHMSSAACCTLEWKLTGVLPRGVRSWRCAVGSFSVSRSGLTANLFSLLRSFHVVYKCTKHSGPETWLSVIPPRGEHHVRKPQWLLNCSGTSADGTEWRVCRQLKLY